MISVRDLRFVQKTDVPEDECPGDGWTVFAISSSKQSEIFLSDAYMMQTDLYRRAYAWVRANVAPSDVAWQGDRVYLRCPNDALAFKMACC
ncbi:MAG: hypothetical protein EOO77_33970 [Oxalobacteraceae bacterium]|nr:MAG: hypothetical protein EOO77_33970 [Oxalobacteraceae bacterium]